jgi:hypothetical protein
MTRVCRTFPVNGDLFKCARRLYVYFGLYTYASTSQKITSNGKIFLICELKIMWKEADMALEFPEGIEEN